VSLHPEASPVPDAVLDAVHAGRAPPFRAGYVSGGTSSRSLGGDANGSARGTPPIDDASVWDARLAAALGSLWTNDGGSYTSELPREAAGELVNATKGGRAALLSSLAAEAGAAMAGAAKARDYAAAASWRDRRDAANAAAEEAAST